MTMVELRDCLYELVQSFFSGSLVVWAEQHMVAASLPQVTLKLKDAGIPLFSVDIQEEKDLYAYYHCTRILEINRYSKGELPGILGEKEIAAVNNTAVEELSLFLVYMQSEQVLIYNYEKNMNIVQVGPIHDLTALEKETRYKYRAMQEYRLDFILKVNRGIGGMTEDSAGNGDKNNTLEIYTPNADKNIEKGSIGYFENAELEGGHE